MDDVIIDIKNLTKTFRVGHVEHGFKNMLLHLPRYIKSRRNARIHTALDNINLTIKRGERIGLVGHNGCGKTTLLSVIGGVYRSYSGECNVYGRCSMMLALSAGFSPRLSGRENIMLNGILQGKTRREMVGLMDEIIDFVELGDYVDAPLYQYSSGMLARLGFGIITAIDPEILLVDEVMAVGDVDFKKKCDARMEKLLSKGTTLLLVSHNKSDIDRYCNRIVKIDHGRIVEDRKVSETAPLTTQER